MEFPQSVGTPSGLALGAGISGQLRARPLGNQTRVDSSLCRQCHGSGNQGFHHLRFPALGPTIAAAHPARHAELRDFRPDDAVMTGPGPNTFVALIRPAIAGFLVTPEAGKTELLSRPLQHLDHIPRAHHQGLTQRGQGPSQLTERLPAEPPLPLGRIGLLPQLRLHHIEG